MLKKIALLSLSCIIVYSSPINAGKSKKESSNKEKSTTEEPVRYSLDHIFEQRESNEIKKTYQFLKKLDQLSDAVKQRYFLELQRSHKKNVSSFFLSIVSYWVPTGVAIALFITRECGEQLCVADAGYSVSGGVVLALMTTLWSYGIKEKVASLNIIKKIMQDFARKEPNKVFEGYRPKKQEESEGSQKLEKIALV